MYYYFVIATMIAIVLMAISIVTVEKSELFLMFVMISGFWVLLALCPGGTGTDRTIVSRANPTEYRIAKLDPYHSVLIADINSNEPVAQRIRDSFTLHKIESGKFRVIKHTHLNLFGQEVYKTTYFVKLLK